MNSSRSELFRLCSDVRFRIVGGEAVVLRQTDAEVLVLNGVASRMLELLAKGTSIADVQSRLDSEYEVESEELRADLESFVDELEQVGVLEPALPDPAP